MVHLPPTRIGMALALMGFAMTISFTTSLRAQHLSSARGIGLAAYTSLAADASALDWNPAGLVSIHDVELSTTSFFSPGGAAHAPTFHLGSIGKRFSSEQAAAFRLSPGSELEFVVPTTIVIQDSAAEFRTQFDKQITYRERYALGYAAKLSSRTSLGVSAHYLVEEVTDTRYSLDTNSIVRSDLLNYSGASWSLDWGFQWQPDDVWRFGAVAKNLFHITESSLDEEVRQYSLDLPKLLRLGASFAGFRNTILSLDFDTERRYRFGCEWNVLPALSLQSGIYADDGADGGVSADAISVGVGGSYQNLRLDLGYLAFFSLADRQGKADLREFQRSPITDIEYNRFTGNRIALSAQLTIGRTHEALARIEYVEMLSDVFPASKNVYAFRPLGKARVRNISAGPINAKVSFYDDHVMDVPTESKPYAIGPGEVMEIPFFAVFNDGIHAISSRAVEEGDVYVDAAPENDHDDRYQARFLVRGKNDWNGDVTLLKYFVTPEDPDVVKLTRSVLSAGKSFLDTVPAVMRDFRKAGTLFDDFAGRVVYVSDPKASADYVQYPAETLSLHGGDCDDMSVCFAAMLSSVGISPAFVDVVPPEHPEDAHVYLLFDTGIDALHARLVSDNPKRYVLRKNGKGSETVWIPLETTALKKGFAEAWSVGAQEYFSDVELKLGRVKGWVNVVDFETVF